MSEVSRQRWRPSASSLAMDRSASRPFHCVVIGFVHSYLAALRAATRSCDLDVGRGVCVGRCGDGIDGECIGMQTRRHSDPTSRTDTHVGRGTRFAEHKQTHSNVFSGPRSWIAAAVATAAVLLMMLLLHTQSEQQCRPLLVAVRSWTLLVCAKRDRRKNLNTHTHTHFRVRSRYIYFVGYVVAHARQRRRRRRRRRSAISFADKLQSTDFAYSRHELTRHIAQQTA